MIIEFEDYPREIAAAIERAAQHTTLVDNPAAQADYSRVVIAICDYARECDSKECNWLVKEYAQPLIKHAAALLDYPKYTESLQICIERGIKAFRIFPRLEFEINKIWLTSVNQCNYYDDFGKCYLRNDVEAGEHNIPLADKGITDIHLYKKKLQTHPSVWTKHWEESITPALLRLNKEMEGMTEHERWDNRWSILKRILKEDYDIEWLDPMEMEDVIQEEKEEEMAKESAKKRPQELKDLEIQDNDSTDVMLEKGRKAFAILYPQIENNNPPRNNYEWTPVVDFAMATVVKAREMIDEQASYGEVVKLLREGWVAAEIISSYYTYTNRNLKLEILEAFLDLVEKRPRFTLAILKRMDRFRDSYKYYNLVDTEWLKEEIAFYTNNIKLADERILDAIVQHPDEHLKSDPIEWTARWEEVIDDAEIKAEKVLKDEYHGRGFCHAYWNTLRQILCDDYGIEWHSPQAMNPRVRFD